MNGYELIQKMQDVVNNKLQASINTQLIEPEQSQHDRWVETAISLYVNARVAVVCDEGDAVSRRSNTEADKIFRAHLHTHPAAVPKVAVSVPFEPEQPQDEQKGFEEWARSQNYDMECHPLHYLFLNTRTWNARQGWKEGVNFARKYLLPLSKVAVSVPFKPTSNIPLPLTACTSDVYNVNARLSSTYVLATNPQPIGFLCITSSYKIAQLVKPEQKHLDNMLETFGWKWEDAVTA